MMKKLIFLLALILSLVSQTIYGQDFNFTEASNSTDFEYLYDANGNMIKDSNKNIANIQYNSLNLPGKVEFVDGRSIEYTYTANGTKLRTVHKNGSNIEKKTDYCGNKVYENDQLSKILFDGGYITMSGNTPTYHYYLQDHQGNNRVVTDQNGNVEEVNHYYPFGGIFEIAQNVQPYKYNGKELDRTYGLDLYDYSARFMDPKLGRFTTMDPMAEKYYSVSPYAYCANNPMRYIDPTGREMIGYTVNRNGTLKPVNTEGGASYHVIYRGEYNPGMRKDYDETGTRSGLKVGRLISISPVKLAVMDNETWEKTGEKINHGYILEAGEGTSKVLEFIEKDLDVEVGNVSVEYDNTGKKENLIMTSHEKDIIDGSMHQINKLVSKGAKVVRDDHNHPSGNSLPSKKGGDLDKKKEILKHSPNAEFRIRANGEYYSY
ncbi:RHS repeat domain-containing protein [Bacteroides sp. 51]|uniref:RHS repeat domain-containing protein n=1 Tax=Bacteroides sp. 51 TaxID=2302938 RepID=UPI0013D60336|nr:RHS repeat-associated core domain-containing protein [Bacteroides sp. 51]